MKNTPLLAIARHTSPNPVSLICAKPANGPTNLATVSWYTLLSLQPERIGFALQKTHYTGEIITITKKAILTIPGLSLAKQVIECGVSSGRKIDKAKQFGIEMLTLPGADIEIPLHSVVAIRCQLHEKVDVGDHYFYICDVEQALVTETDEAPLFAWNGYEEIATVTQKAGGQA